jgi:hypothetical protein
MSALFRTDMLRSQHSLDETGVHLPKGVSIAGATKVCEVLQSKTGRIDEFLLDQIGQFRMLSNTLHHLVNNRKAARIVCLIVFENPVLATWSICSRM